MFTLSRSGSKTIDRKLAEKTQASHLERLNKIKRSSSQTSQLQNNNSEIIKNASFLRNNDKKKELKKEQQNIQVERDNRILLSKITKIVNNPMLRDTFYNFQNIQQINEAKSKSMNHHLRKQEIEKVAAENPAIAHRISQQSSFYDVKKWEKDFKARDAYIKNLCEFPQTAKHSPERSPNERNSMKSFHETDSPTKKHFRTRTLKSPNLHRRSLSTDLSSNKTPNDKIAKKLVLYRKESEVNGSPYLIEFSIVEKKFQISANPLNELSSAKYLILGDEAGKQLLIENNNNYEKIISKLHLQGDKIEITGFCAERKISGASKIELFDSLSYTHFPNPTSTKKETENVK